MMRLTLLCAAIFALSGCQHVQQGPMIPDSSCVAYKVIKPAEADTIGTKRQVLVHNNTYRRICTNG